MAVFSGKSERKWQRNKVSTAYFQSSIALEDGRAVEESPFCKDIYCLTETEILNLLKELSGTGWLALTSSQSWRLEKEV